MGTTTLSTRRTNLQKAIGKGSGQTLSTDLSNTLDFSIQTGLRFMYNRKRWPFLWNEWKIELQAAYGTGTVTVDVDADVNAVTGTDTAWDTLWTTHVKIRTQGVTYRVSSVDSTTALTTTDNVLYDITDESYYLFIDRYTVNSTTDAENIETMFVDSPERRLKPSTAAEMADYKSRGYRVGHPAFWAPAGEDASGDLIVELWPIPAYNEILHVQGWKVGTIPTADGNTDSIPDRWSHIVDQFALAYVQKYLHDDQWQASMSLAMGMLQEMEEQAVVAQGPDGLMLDPAQFGPPRLPYGTQVIEWE